MKFLAWVKHFKSVQTCLRRSGQRQSGSQPKLQLTFQIVALLVDDTMTILSLTILALLLLVSYCLEVKASPPRDGKSLKKTKRQQKPLFPSKKVRSNVDFMLPDVGGTFLVAFGLSVIVLSQK